MHARVPIVTVIVAILWGPAQLASSEYPDAIVDQRYGKSVRGSIDGFPFLLLRGSHAERGEAHGFLAAREAVQSCDRMSKFLDRAGVDRGRILATLEQFEIPDRYRLEVEGLYRGILRALPESADRQLPTFRREVSREDLILLQVGDLLEVSRCSQFSAWGEMTPEGDIIIGRNWDYPDVFPRASACLIAVDPSEPGLRPTLDAMWCGKVGAGLGCLRDDGLFIAANSGGQAIKDGSFSKPQPGALLMRTVAETAPASNTVPWMIRALDRRMVLPVIFHVVPPGAGSRGTPVAIEYTPRPETFGIRVRKPVEHQDILLMTNHFVSLPRDRDRGRFEKMDEVLRNCKVLKTPVGFAEARATLDSAHQGGSTYFSLVVWPKRRVMRVAVGRPGASATKSRFSIVSWDRLFSLQ